MGAAYSNNDTAVFYFQKALKISINLGDKLGQGTNLMNIGFIRMKEKRFTEALLNFRQSLGFAAELNNHLHMARCYLNFGYCYYQAKRMYPMNNKSKLIWQKRESFKYKYIKYYIFSIIFSMAPKHCTNLFCRKKNDSVYNLRL